MHRKVHLFDIDIPGKIKFKVSLAWTALSLFVMRSLSLGKRDVECGKHY